MTDIFSPGRPPGPGSSLGVPATAGGVATWLPEGRWATSAQDVGGGPGGSAPDRPDDPAEAVRRRGRRRVAAARLAARLAGWPRRVAAGTLLLAAVLVALRPDPPAAEAPPPPPGVTVVVAARDLPAGTTLSVADLRTVALPAAVVPAGAAREPRSLLGRTVAGAVRRGEPVTDVRVVGPGLTAGLGPDGSVAVPVRLADAQAATLVRAGDRVDVLGTPVDAAPRAGDAVEVAVGVRVLAVLRGSDAADGVLLVVAASPAVARGLAGAAAGHRLSVAVRPP